MLNKLRKRVRSEKGFTLIELLVVMIILGILTAIAIPSYLSFKGRANDSAAKANLRTLLPSVESYYADTGGYTGMTLAALQASYDQALTIANYSILGTPNGTSYCLKSVSGDKAFYKQGPAGQITATACTGP